MLTLYVDTTSRVVLSNLTDDEGNTVTGANVTVEIETDEGTQAVNLSDFGGGTYEAYLPSDLSLTPLRTYTVKTVAEKNGTVASWYDTVKTERN